MAQSRSAPPQTPRPVPSASEATGVPRTRGHLRVPFLCSRPWHSDPQAICPLLPAPALSSGGGGSPSPRPLLSPASSRPSEFSGRAGRETPSRQHPTAVTQADCASSSSGPALGWTARNKPRRRRLFSHGGWAAASHLLPGGRCLVGCWRWAKLSVPEAFRKVSPVSGGRDSRKPTHSRLCQTQPRRQPPPRQGDKELGRWRAELEAAGSRQARPPGAKPCLAGRARLRAPEPRAWWMEVRDAGLPEARGGRQVAGGHLGSCFEGRVSSELNWQIFFCLC